jgi:hypothetical protein
MCSETDGKYPLSATWMFDMDVPIETFRERYRRAGMDVTHVHNVRPIPLYVVIEEYVKASGMLESVRLGNFDGQELAAIVTAA